MRNGAVINIKTAAIIEVISIKFLVLLNPLSRLLPLSLAKIGKTAAEKEDRIAEAEIDKLKGQAEANSELRIVFDEKFQRLDEEIGSLREQLLDRERDIEKLWGGSMNKSDVTIIITTYRRKSHIRQIANSWLLQCPNVIIANGGDPIEHLQPEIHQHLYNPDPGNKIRFSSALLSDTPYILMADDDVMPLPGLLDDFISHYKAFINRTDLMFYPILGIIGRQMTNPVYWKWGFVKASKLIKPVETDFVGVLYFTHRENIIMDLSNFTHRAIDDLNWQLVEMPNVPKYVISTKNYQNILELCNDSKSIFKTPESREVREAFWKKHYKEEKK